MDKLKQHITLYIALLFLAAQGMGTLHFFFIHHEFETNPALEDLVISTSQVNHQCDFKLFKNPAGTPVLFLKEKKNISVFLKESNFVYNEPLIKRHKNIRYLRGPPQVGG